MQSGEGAEQWEAIIWKQSVGFTIHPYLVRLTLLGAMHIPVVVTYHWSAEFLLAGIVSATADEPEAAVAFSPAVRELQPT